MSIDKLRRVMWRLDELQPQGTIINLKDVRRAIMEEIGTDDRTIVEAIKKLKELKWLKQLKRFTFVSQME